MFELWRNQAEIPCPICGCNEYRYNKQYAEYGFVFCSSCHHHFIQPFPQFRDLNEAFNDYSWTNEYSRKFDDHLPRVTKALQFKVKKAQALTKRPITTFLDVGCGNGLYLKAGEDIGLYCVGTDVDQSNINFAQSKGLNAIYTDLKNFMPVSTFDFIHAKGVLHLVQNPVELLLNMKRLLSNRGVIFIDASYQDGLFSILRRIFFSNKKRYGQILPPLHNMTFTKKSFIRLLELTSFQPHTIFTFSKGSPNYYPSTTFSFQALLGKVIDPINRGASIAAYCTLK